MLSRSSEPSPEVARFVNFDLVLVNRLLLSAQLLKAFETGLGLAGLKCGHGMGVTSQAFEY